MGERGEADAALAARPASVRQSSAKPADGGSNATGSAAIAVQTSHSASGSGTCAYWIGRPCRASPASTRCAAAVEPQLDEPRMAEQRARRRRRAGRAQAVARRQRRRRRPVLGARAVIAGAEHDRDEAGRVAEATASRRAGPRSARRSARACRAGSPARSRRRWRRPGRRARTGSPSAARGRCAMRPSASTTSSRGRSARPGRSAAIMRCTPTGRTARPAARRASLSMISAAASSGRFSVERIGIGHGQRVQRRVHVAGVDREEAGRRRPSPPRPRSRSGGQAPPCWRRRRPSRDRR